MSNIIFIVHIGALFTQLLCGVFAAAVRGVRSPMLYLQIYWFANVLLGIANLLQTFNTPVYGKALWNPMHILMLLTVCPLLFAYIFGMVRQGGIAAGYWLRSYLPAAGLAALYFTFGAMFGKLPLVSTYNDLRHCLVMPQLWVLFAGAGFSVAMIAAYTLRATRLLRQHKRNLFSDFSYIEGNTLGWMWWAITLTLLKWFFLMLLFTTEGSAVSLVAIFFNVAAPILITILALRQKDLYPPPATKENSIPVNEEIGTAEWTSEKLNLLKESLSVLLDKEEVFKNPELSSTRLSEMLKTNRNYLSRVINQEMKTTFYDLINTRRLAKSVEMMSDPLHRYTTISTIAELCGFKSLSIFSRYFSKSYGKSPSEWRREQRKKETAAPGL